MYTHMYIYNVCTVIHICITILNKSKHTMNVCAFKYIYIYIYTWPCVSMCVWHGLLSLDPARFCSMHRSYASITQCSEPSLRMPDLPCREILCDVSIQHAWVAHLYPDATTTTISLCIHSRTVHKMLLLVLGTMTPCIKSNVYPTIACSQQHREGYWPATRPRQWSLWRGQSSFWQALLQYLTVTMYELQPVHLSNFKPSAGLALQFAQTGSGLALSLFARVWFQNSIPRSAMDSATPPRKRTFFFASSSRSISSMTS